MVISVMVSVVSVGFGFYQNIAAGNSTAFIYEQAYRIIGQIQEANIPASAKAQLTDDALKGLGAPPPVIDLSQSSADIGDGGPCDAATEALCTGLGERLGVENASCEKGKEPTGPVCGQAARTRAEISGGGCFTCFSE